MQKQILLLLLVCFTLPCRAADAGDRFSPFVETFADGRIDWDDGVIYGVGKGYLDRNGGDKGRAFRAAQVTALQSILKLAAGIRLNDRETVKSLGGGRVALHLRALIRYQEAGDRFVGETDRPHFEVTRKADIKGVEGLTARLLDHFRSAGVAWEAYPEPSAETAPEPETETWLVLDARGEEVVPALFPQVVDEAGRAVYGIEEVGRESLARRGMARYVVSDLPPGRLGADRSDLEGLIDRVLSGLGPSPAIAQEGKEEKQDRSRRRKRRKYVVKDVKAAQGLMKANLVVSEGDARDLKEVDVSSRILKKCRVIIVVNSPLGGIEGMRRPFFFADATTGSP